jgi:hypothetical protein
MMQLQIKFNYFLGLANQENISLKSSLSNLSLSNIHPRRLLVKNVTARVNKAAFRED